MIKKSYIFLLFLVVCVSCSNSSSYSDQLKAEEKLIASFIARQGLVIVEDEPQEWGEKVYWKVPDYDNFYFHLVSPGDTSFAVETGDNVNLRFIRYTLEAYADTMRVWNTDDNPNPVRFQYWKNDENACTGWQVAVKYMKYHQAQCKIICPSKLGFRTENRSVTPYGYDIKIQINKQN